MSQFSKKSAFAHTDRQFRVADPQPFVSHSAEGPTEDVLVPRQELESWYNALNDVTERTPLRTSATKSDLYDLRDAIYRYLP